MGQRVILTRVKNYTSKLDGRELSLLFRIFPGPFLLIRCVGKTYNVAVSDS